MKILDKINQQSFKSIFTLASGSIIAQIIVIITAPALTRLYSPTELGAYSYLLSIVFIFMGVINGRYEQSIVTEEQEEKVNAIVKLSLIFGILLSLIITAGYTIFLVLNNNLNDKGGTIHFILLVLLSYAVINVLTFYNNRYKEYRTMSYVYIIRTGFQNLGAVAAGLFNFGIAGLTTSYLIGQIFGIKKQGESLISKIQQIKDISWQQMGVVARLHKRQPLFAAPAALANSFSYSSIMLFIESLYGFTALGFYSISVRLLGLPLSVISGNVSKVFFETASKEYNATGQFFTAFKKTFFFQLALSIPMVVVMMLFAPMITKIIFGKEWEIAGDYIIILAPMFGIRFIVTTLTLSVVIISKQKFEFLIQCIFVLSSVIIYLVCKISKLPIETLLLLISISYSAVYIFFLLAVYKFSRGKLIFFSTYNN